MESNNVVQDAVGLAKAILDSLLPTDRWTIVNVARNGDRIINLTNISEIPPSFGYSFDNVQRLLHQEGVIEAVVRDRWFAKVVNTPLRSAATKNDPITSIARKKGYMSSAQYAKFYESIDLYIRSKFGPKMSGQAAILINVNSLLEFVKKYNSLKTTQRDYIYENGELHITLKNGSNCTLDLSKAHILRPVFESFFYLFHEGNSTLFTKEEVLKKYRELSRNEIDWRVLIKRKSSIVGKMINTKDCLKKRISWKYDNKEKKYKFEILPLSDK